MSAILSELQKWATELPFWEQVALDTILKGEEISASDCEQLVQYLLVDAGIEEPTSARPELLFLKVAGENGASTSRLTYLVSVSNLQNVNALISGQTLTFGPALTVIYGTNGSGKSGYSRMIGCAGFTRGDDYVLPDVTNPVQEGETPSAEFEIEIDGERVCINYQVGSYHPELKCVYMLDSAAARVHLTKSNTITFSPYGLSALTELSAAIDRVRDHLHARIEREVVHRDFSCLFTGDSEVAKLVAALGLQTDLEALRAVATLSDVELGRLTELDIAIAKLIVEYIPEQEKQLEQTIEDLRLLSQRIDQVAQALGDESIADISPLVVALNELRRQEQDSGAAQFQLEHFTQIGSSSWLRFLKAARDFAKAERGDEDTYPTVGDHCLFCQQLLHEEQRELIYRIWDFLDAGISVRLAETKAALSKKHDELARIELDFFNEQAVSFRYLESHDRDLLATVRAFMESCNNRCEILMRVIESQEPEEMIPVRDSGVRKIQDVIKALETDRDQMRAQNVEVEIEQLRTELLTLQHRAKLAEHLPEIERYIERLIWAHKAEAACRDTRHITRKHGQLFKVFVSERYIEAFRKTLADLGFSLKVDIETKGAKGERFKQLVLRIDPSAPNEATPDRVLSEGEKRAVALADFLTEVTLDEGCNTIVLDDPVTSLDADWKEKIASRVIEEAQRRQVAVFTHDLPFLYLLKKYAETQGVEICSHWIKRGDTDEKPGYVWLDNCPTLEKDYRKTTKAREWHKKALHASPEEQEAFLKSGFAALRTNYEAFIILDLFAEVVQRFDARISPGRLKDIVWDDEIANEVIKKHEGLSSYIEGHWHADERPASAPTPKMLLEEIEALEALKRKLADLRKARTKG